MGLFAKEKKATWEGDSDGAYIFYLGNEANNESSRNAWCWEDLIVYCETNDSHYRLRDYSRRCDGNRYEAELIGQSEPLLYVQDEELSFFLLEKGAVVNDNFLTVRVNEDLWIYNPETGCHYVLEEVTRVKPGIFVAPALVGESAEDGFFYRIEKYKFRFVYQGDEHSSTIIAQMSDDDVILLLPDADRQFVVRGGMQLKIGVWQKDSFSNPGDLPLFRKLGPVSYHLYDRGKNIAGKCKAVKTGANTIVYDPEKTQNYWVENGAELKDGAYQDATPFAQGCKVLWYRNTGGYHIYYETEEITRQIQLQRYENSAILMHEASMSMYQLENFFNTTDGVVRGV